MFPDEGETVERKTGAGQKGLQRSIAAFSNTAGGVILLGVDDDGSIVGRSMSRVEDAIHQAVQTLHDPGRYGIHEIDVEGKPVTVVSVERRSEGFTQLPDSAVLVRRGAHTVPLFGAELERLVMDRALRRFELAASGVPLAEADRDIVADVRKVYGWQPKELEARLREHGLLMGDGQPELTIAGALGLLKNPSEHLGKTYIEVLRYPDEGVNYDRRVELAGPVHDQVASTVKLVMDELGTDLIVSGLRRYELPKIPEVVIREGVSNAAAHRRYEETGTAVRIELRPDSVVVVSPGGLPEPVTEENIREAQYARNFSVLRFLRKFDLAEDNGRGVDVMQDEMTGALLDPPRFQDLGHAVKVTLPIRGAISPQERAWVFEVERRGALEPVDRITLVHAARGEELTNSKVRELLGADTRDARASLKRLRDAGFLQQVGQRGGTTYRLDRSVGAPAAFRLSAPDLEEFVVSLAEKETLITNSRVRAATGLDRAEALRVLDKLVRDDRLRRLGERRGTVYIVAGSDLDKKLMG